MSATKIPTDRAHVGLAVVLAGAATVWGAVAGVVWWAGR